MGVLSRSTPPVHEAGACLDGSGVAAVQQTTGPRVLAEARSGVVQSLDRDDTFAAVEQSSHGMPSVEKDSAQLLADQQFLAAWSQHPLLTISNACLKF